MRSRRGIAVSLFSGMADWMNVPLLYFEGTGKAPQRVGLAQALTLSLQAFDNQPGISIPFRDLDYGRVERWLAAILDLDPAGQYPLLMATHLYGQIPDPACNQRMYEFARRKFLEDPDRRWPPTW